MTTLCNVKVSFLRKEGYDNFEKWLEDENNVYVGRNGRIFINKQIFHYKGSIWQNPFKKNKDMDIDEVLKKYKKYIKDKLKNGEISKEELIKLKDKNLGCWCIPKPKIEMNVNSVVMVKYY